MPGYYGGYLGNEAGMIAGNPSFEINKRPGAGPQLPLAYGTPGQPGNMAGIANAEFYMGPQYAQLPPGFQNKFVS